MSYSTPQNLYYCYKRICGGSLVTFGDFANQSALTEFEAILNLARPQDEKEMMLYNYIRGISSSNKFGFLNLIKGTNQAASVLWATPSAIVKWFNLEQMIYIQYDDSKYTVSYHKNILTRDGELDTDAVSRIINDKKNQGDQQQSFVNYRRQRRNTRKQHRNSRRGDVQANNNIRNTLASNTVNWESETDDLTIVGKVQEKNE